MLTKRTARKFCNEIVAKRCPGYYLLMDRLSRDAYASLWGKDELRLEIVVNRKQTVPMTAHIASYKIF